MNALTALERAHLYAAKVPPAVQGQSGSDATFALAVKLTRGFNLGPDGAFPVLEKWNQTCMPPWSEAELRHKLKDADTRGTEARGSALGNQQTMYRPQTRPAAPTPSTIDSKPKPDRAGFSIGTAPDILALAANRPYAREGLELASRRGLLVFGKCCGVDSYAITDKSGWVLEARRVDGQLFAKTEYLNERKSHAIKGSRKSWPVGILEAADCKSIALVEGIPDFLTALYLSLWEGKESSCGIVCMLSSSPSIAENALPHFRGKHVRIFPHSDQAGIEGASTWKKQLQPIAAKVDAFDLGQYRMPDGGRVNDLWDAFHPPRFYPVIPLPERMLP